MKRPKSKGAKEDVKLKKDDALVNIPTVGEDSRLEPSSEWIKFLMIGFGGVISVTIAVIFYSNAWSVAEGVDNVASLNVDAGSSSTNKPMLFGFLPDYRFDSLAVDFVVPRVTHLCLFGSEADKATGSLIARLPSEDRLAAIKAIAKASSTKLFLGLGGAGRSEFFAAVLANKARAARLLDNLIDVCRKHGFVGVELNWMYPTRAQDIQHLSAFVNLLRKADLLTSMAIPPDEQFAQALSGIGFDFFHVMYYQAKIGGPTAHAERLLRSISKHIQPNRLTLGVPFYGLNKASNEAVSFEDILKSEDAKAKFNFEDRALLSDKLELARRESLAGLSIWELGQDCRPHAVGRHGQTCPHGEADTLLAGLR
jgi:GH18 family chitinase